jgi:hypothetical protein
MPEDLASNRPDPLASSVGEEVGLGTEVYFRKLIAKIILNSAFDNNYFSN